VGIYSLSFCNAVGKEVQVSQMTHGMVLLILGKVAAVASGTTERKLITTGTQRLQDANTARS